MTVVTRVVVTLYTVPMTESDSVSPCDDGYIYIPIAFVIMLYLVYLVECWHCHTRIQLQYKVDVSSVYDRIQAMSESIPVVWWKAVCYHYVRRTRQVTRYRNGDAFTTTQVYYERVNTYNASAAFDFGHCGVKDISKHLVNLDHYPATKIRFTKGFSFATQDTEREFEEQRMHFFQEHERRDDYMEVREGLDLLNMHFKEYVIAFADKDHLPWYVSQVVFWISSLFLLSWPLRVLIDWKTAYVHYHIHKLFGSNYLDSSLGTMTRVSTMGSSELEIDIRNNYTLVPSYSEALLMDSALRQDSNGNITFDRGSLIAVNGAANGLSPNGNIPNGQVLSNGHISSANMIYGSFQATNRPRSIILSNGHIPGAYAIISPPSNGPKVRWKRKRKKQKRHRHSDGSLSQSEADSSLVEILPEVHTLPRSMTQPKDLRSQLKHSNTFPHPSAFSPGASTLSPGSGLPTDSEETIPPPPGYEAALNMQPLNRHADTDSDHTARQGRHPESQSTTNNNKVMHADLANSPSNASQVRQLPDENITLRDRPPSKKNQSSPVQTMQNCVPNAMPRRSRPVQSSEEVGSLPAIHRPSSSQESRQYSHHEQNGISQRSNQHAGHPGRVLCERMETTL